MKNKSNLAVNILDSSRRLNNEEYRKLWDCTDQLNTAITGASCMLVYQVMVAESVLHPGETTFQLVKSMEDGTSTGHDVFRTYDEMVLHIELVRSNACKSKQDYQVLLAETAADEARANADEAFRMYKSVVKTLEMANRLRSEANDKYIELMLKANKS